MDGKSTSIVTVDIPSETSTPILLRRFFAHRRFVRTSQGEVWIVDGTLVSGETSLCVGQMAVIWQGGPGDDVSVTGYIRANYRLQMNKERINAVLRAWLADLDFNGGVISFTCRNGDFDFFFR